MADSFKATKDLSKFIRNSSIVSSGAGTPQSGIVSATDEWYIIGGSDFVLVVGDKKPALVDSVEK